MTAGKRYEVECQDPVHSEGTSRHYTTGVPPKALIGRGLILRCPRCQAQNKGEKRRARRAREDQQKRADVRRAGAGDWRPPAVLPTPPKGISIAGGLLRRQPDEDDE